jgi:hypothetical protein
VTEGGDTFYPHPTVDLPSWQLVMNSRLSHNPNSLIYLHSAKEKEEKAGVMRSKQT